MLHCEVEGGGTVLDNRQVMRQAWREKKQKNEVECRRRGRGDPGRNVVGHTCNYRTITVGKGMLGWWL